MGQALEIHPVLKIFTVMVGAVVGGIVGIYLSLPLVAALRVVWRRFVRPIPPMERAPALLSGSKTDQLMLAQESSDDRCRFSHACTFADR